MADFSIWHVLPMGEMPTVRQVLECGGGRWINLPWGGESYMVIDGDSVVCAEVDPAVGMRTWRDIARSGARFAVIDPRPIEAPMPTAAEVGDESRWRILCAHKPEGDACTMRAVGGRIEALFDGDDQWVDLASQWGAGMVAVKEASCTSA